MVEWISCFRTQSSQALRNSSDKVGWTTIFNGMRDAERTLTSFLIKELKLPGVDIFSYSCRSDTGMEKFHHFDHFHFDVKDIMFELSTSWINWSDTLLFQKSVYINKQIKVSISKVVSKKWVKCETDQWLRIVKMQLKSCRKCASNIQFGKTGKNAPRSQNWYWWKQNMS